MGIQDFGTIGADASLKQVIDVLADLQDTLNFLLNGNLDVKNLRASSITADRLKVQQLSAIAADLGTITAGIIYGAYIATSNGTFPRVELNSANNLIAAYVDPDTYVAFLPSYNSVPALVLVDNGTIKAFLNRGDTVGGTTIGTFDGEAFNIQPSGPLRINGSNGYNGPIGYVKDVVAGTPIYGSITVTKGIITSVT